MRTAQAREAGKRIRKMKPEDVTVGLWLLAWETFLEVPRSRSTVVRERQIVGPLMRSELGLLRMSELRRVPAQAWILQHPAQLKFLRRLWKLAILNGFTMDNVWLDVVIPRRRPSQRRPPSSAELAAIVARARGRGGWHEQVFADLVLVAAYTGMRSGGVCALTRLDVNLGAGRMNLHEKGAKDRTVAVCGPAVPALARAVAVDYPAWPGYRGHALVWRTTEGHQLSPDYVGRAWRTVRGDFPYGFHSLKHFAATWLHEQGVSDLDIAVQLGHTDSMGRPYAQLVERRYRHYDTGAALDRIARIAA